MTADRAQREITCAVCEILETRRLLSAAPALPSVAVPDAAGNNKWGSITISRQYPALTAVGDLNNDGYADLAVAIPDAGGFEIELLVNNQHGQLVLQTAGIQVNATNLAFASVRLAIGDSNGQPELAYRYLARPGKATIGSTTSATVNVSGGVFFLEGDPDRPIIVGSVSTFTVQLPPPRILRTTDGIALAPLTGAQGPDDVVLWSGSELAVLYGSASGQLSAPAYLSNPFEAVSATGATTSGQIVGLADMNGDGIPDLLAVYPSGYRLNRKSAKGTVASAIGVITTAGGSTGTASPTWSLLPAVQFTEIGSAQIQPVNQVLIGDLNGDGVQDLVLVAADTFRPFPEQVQVGSNLTAKGTDNPVIGLGSVVADDLPGPLFIGQANGGNDAVVFALAPVIASDNALEIVPVKLGV
jgi:hypothetical protein